MLQMCRFLVRFSLSFECRLAGEVVWHVVVIGEENTVNLAC